MPYLESEALAETPQVGADWIPPASEFGELPGAVAATRVGDYRAEINLTAGGGGHLRGRFIGVDRIPFSCVA